MRRRCLLELAAVYIVPQGCAVFSKIYQSFIAFAFFSKLFEFTSDIRKMADTKESHKRVDKPPGKTACLYISSIFLVTIAISTLSLLRLLISICHYEYTNGRTVCAPQSVVLQKLPVEIPSKTLFLRVGGLEYDAAGDSFRDSGNENLSKHTEHRLEVIDRSNFSRFKDLKELALIRCGIKRVAEMAFADLLKLKKLDLRFNQITSLGGSTFTGLNLTLLDLSHNLIFKLSAFAFSGSIIRSLFFSNSSHLLEIEPLTFSNSSVEHMRIESSRISFLSNETLGDLASSLVSLSIINQQTPLDIHQNLFTNFSLLAILDLSNASLVHIDFLTSTHAREIVLGHNDITNASDYYSDTEGKVLHHGTKKLSLASTRLVFLPSFFIKGFRNLSHLDLSYNKLTSIDVSLFNPLHDLQVLDLSNNNISTLTSFNNNTLSYNLSCLYLHNNNIRTLSEQTMSIIVGLREFTFQQNVLHCNCEVKWLASFIKDVPMGREAVKDWQHINCSTPLNVSLVKLNTEDFVCTPPGAMKTSHKEVLEEKGVVLSCEVSSDPASNITWRNDLMHQHNTSLSYPNLFNIFKITDNYSNDSNKSDSSVHKISLEMLVLVDEFTTRSQLFVSFPGNYTCHASNIVATANHTFNTDLLTLTGAHFNRGAEKAEVLSSYEGALLVAVLLILLGLLVNRDSHTFE